MWKYLSSDHPFIYYTHNIFCLNAYVTLTYDLVALTLGQYQHSINTNHMCKSHQGPILPSWFQCKSSPPHQRKVCTQVPLPLCLGFGLTSTSYPDQSYVKISSSSDHLFTIWSLNRLLNDCIFYLALVTFTLPQLQDCSH